MALLQKWFEKDLTLEEIDEKFAEAEARRSQKIQQQSLISQSIDDLKKQVQETLVESMLSDDAGLSKRRRDLRAQMSELRRSHDELAEEIAAMDPLQTTLIAKKTEAIKRVKLLEYDRKSAELAAVTKDISPLVISLGEKLREAAKIVSELGGMTPNSAPYRPGSLWVDSIYAWFAKHLDGSEIAGLPRSIDVNSQRRAELTSLVESIDRGLKSIRGSISDSTSRN